ncbi:alpha/beta fold hydrolase [Arenimonas fontis]|uniref:Alpha/beta hydrolase n=1 Tax=Arenimonas fontis TaxID=2608255 RepID=A0A5B2ZDX3_9GAMM|nr:alpha/beta hydrolase [Arenimonas fontis]KAA2285242.1 alpha/beta hydrolase [Arenimonas fontis]
MDNRAQPLPATPAPLSLRAGDGLPLAAQALPGGGPGVLLSHGFGQTRQAWSATQARLAGQGLASLAWDARGHGQSARNPPDRPYRGQQFVDDVRVAAAAAGRAPVLIGASMGGLTGLLAQAAARPFSALVLVDITPRWEASGVERILAFMRAHPDGFASYHEAAERIADYLPHRRGRKSPSQLAHLLVPRGDGRLVWHWDPRLLDEFIPDTAGLHSRLEDACRALDVPVLLVSGGRSDLVSDETVAHFLDLAPHARHVRLPEATHMVAGDDNDAFTDTLLEFLHDLAVPPAAASGDSR